jgi:hypothetical protein
VVSWELTRSEADVELSPRYRLFLIAFALLAGCQYPHGQAWNVMLAHGGDGPPPPYWATFLDFPPGRLTDDELAEILPQMRQLPNLVLGLTHSGITDKGMSSLAQLTELRQVDLVGTAVTKEGLARLAGLEKLRTILLDVDQLSLQDAKELQAKMPAVELAVDVREIGLQPYPGSGRTTLRIRNWGGQPGW